MVSIAAGADYGTWRVRHCRCSPPGSGRVLRQQSRLIATLTPSVRHASLLGSDFHPVPDRGSAIPPLSGPGGCRLFRVSGNASPGRRIRQAILE